MAELGIYTSAAFSNSSGLSVAGGASVEVRKESDNSLATLFSDRAGASGISNPFFADSEGRFEFYVAGLPAGFKVTVTKAPDEYILRNQPVGTIQERDSIDVLGLFNAAEPSPTYKYMWWADPATGKLKQRNAANNGWIIKGTLATVIEDFTTTLLNKLNGITAGAEVNPDVVSQSEAEGGAATDERIWTAERVGQAIAALGSGSGKVEQVVNFQTGAVQTGTTVFPSDDTIPQNTEGDQFMALSITPTNAANFLLIEVVCHVSHNSGSTNRLMAAIFQDAIANALAVGFHYRSANVAIEEIVFSHYMVAGTTSQIDFKVRAGGQGGATCTFNGESGARLFGGVLASSITIKEIAV